MDLPDWLPIEAWNDYLQMRKRRKWVTTPRAERMLITKLEGFRDQGYNLEYVIDEATTENWKSFYVNTMTPQTRQSGMRAHLSADDVAHYKKLGLLQ